LSSDGDDEGGPGWDGQAPYLANRVLAALREQDGRRMGDLSATTSIEISTLTRLVYNMERRWRG
jgi:hypothetical protein